MTQLHATVADLEQAAEAWETRGWPRPDIVLVSGSGLAVELAAEPAVRAPLAAALPFPVEGVIGHPLELEIHHLQTGKTVLYYRGRLHSYQGFDAHQTVFPVRLGGLLGASTLVMTNASGSLRADWGPGTAALIRDHVNLIGLNPLRGKLPESWGPQFPDLTTAYDPQLRALARELAASRAVDLPEGVYAGVAGPSYETPAEVAMLRAIGADLVGMSTVLEIIAASHLGMRCLGISIVSNLAAGSTGEPLHHDEVLEAGRTAAGLVAGLLSDLVHSPRIC